MCAIRGSALTMVPDVVQMCGSVSGFVEPPSATADPFFSAGRTTGKLAARSGRMSKEEPMVPAGFQPLPELVPWSRRCPESAAAALHPTRKPACRGGSSAAAPLRSHQVSSSSDVTRDLSAPLFVDTSVEYDLPKEAYPPDRSAHLLMVHPQYFEHLRHRRTVGAACACQLCNFYGRRIPHDGQKQAAAAGQSFQRPQTPPAPTPRRQAQRVPLPNHRRLPAPPQQGPPYRQQARDVVASCQQRRTAAIHHQQQASVITRGQPSASTAASAATMYPCRAGCLSCAASGALAPTFAPAARLFLNSSAGVGSCSAGVGGSSAGVGGCSAGVVNCSAGVVSRPVGVVTCSAGVNCGAFVTPKRSSDSDSSGYSSAEMEPPPALEWCGQQQQHATSRKRAAAAPAQQLQLQLATQYSCETTAKRRRTACWPGAAAGVQMMSHIRHPYAVV